MKRALTGAILIHAASILFAAAVMKDPRNTGLTFLSAYLASAVIGFVGIIALIAACLKKTAI